MTEGAAPAPRIRVWDVPVRVCHWLIVLFVAASWWTAEAKRMDWHRYCGYALLALATFRVYWGFFGSSTARFASFLRGPRAILVYLRGAWRAAPGHNPIGALSVIALLLALVAQIVLGLFAVDVDGIESGPLSLYVSFEAGRRAAEWHEEVFNVLLGLIALHVLAIAWYALFRRENLLSPMFHGTHEYPGDPQPLRPASWVRFVVGVLLAAALTWLVTVSLQPF
jgi:cytochrome b